MDRLGFLGRWVSIEMKRKNESYDFEGTIFSGKVGAPIIVAGSSYWNIGMAGKGGAVDAENDEEGILNINHFASNRANTIKKLNV